MIEQAKRLPYEVKLAHTMALIEWWNAYHGGDVSVSYSGGLDSTVLLHLARATIGQHVPGVFCDTGLEYPEIKAHVRATTNIAIVRPAKPFRQVIKEYGYPVISKKVSQYVHEVQQSRGETATKRLRLTGIRTDGTRSELSMIPKRWQFLCDAPFKIGHKCCEWLKKRPLFIMSAPMLGIRCEESRQRTHAITVNARRWMPHGIGTELKHPVAWPMYHWTHADVWRYVEENGLEVASVYLGESPLLRTGCMFCGFGLHMESPNRIQLMKLTHPKQWEYCLNRLGMKEVLDYCGIPYE